MFSKLLLFGPPGAGKSVFAFQFPKTYFICTDGNYEFLKIFGAKDEDHTVITAWSQMKKLIQEITSTSKFDKYQTIVVDLLEDVWKYCESEWLEGQKIEHPSDMGWGKAYDVPRNKFFIEINKLLSVPKNVILLSHQQIIVHKTKKGTEWNTYAPSNKLPDKLLDSIEGRLTGCLRCYVDITADDTGKQIKKRLLNLVPQDDEFGIIRGVNENEVPHTIELKYSTYHKILEEQQLKVAQEFLNMLESDDDVKDYRKESEKAEIKAEVKNDKDTNVEEEPVRKRRRKTKSDDVTEISEAEGIEPPVERTEEETKEKISELHQNETDSSKYEEKTNEQKKADILRKIQQYQKDDEEKPVTSKMDLLKKLRKAKEEVVEDIKEVEVVEETKEETPVEEEKKPETREEKLARLRKMRK